MSAIFYGEAFDTQASQGVAVVTSGVTTYISGDVPVVNGLNVGIPASGITVNFTVPVDYQAQGAMIHFAKYSTNGTVQVSGVAVVSGNTTQINGSATTPLAIANLVGKSLYNVSNVTVSGLTTSNWISF